MLNRSCEKKHFGKQRTTKIRLKKIVLENISQFDNTEIAPEIDCSSTPMWLSKTKLP